MQAEMIILGILLVLLFAWAWRSGRVKQAGELAGVPDRVARWRGPVVTYASQAGVPWELALAVIWQESAGDPDAVGSAGEQGLMQVKSIAAQDVAQLTDADTGDWQNAARDNIRTGVYYLKLQHRRAGSWPDALAAYNAGYAGSEGNADAYAYADQVLEKARVMGWNG